MAELDAVVELLGRESGPSEEPPGGYAALLRSTLAMWERMPVPVRRFNGWFRRVAAVAAVVMLVAAALLVSDQAQRGVVGSDMVAESSTESGDLLDQLIEEHALATDQVPFSDGAYLAVMAQRDRRR
jgi:hypothetical protein